MTILNNNTFISYFPTKTNLDTKKLTLVFKKKKRQFHFYKRSRRNHLRTYNDLVINNFSFNTSLKYKGRPMEYDS